MKNKHTKLVKGECKGCGKQKLLYKGYCYNCDMKTAYNILHPRKPKCEWCDEETDALYDIKIDGGEYLEVCEGCREKFKEKMFD